MGREENRYPVRRIKRSRMIGRRWGGRKTKVEKEGECHVGGIVNSQSRSEL